MWLRDVVRPVIGIYELGTHTGKCIGIHDTAFVLIHVRQEAYGLNQVKSVLFINVPSTHTSQCRAVIDHAFIIVSVYLFEGTDTLIHVCEVNTSDSINNAIDNDIVAGSILCDGLTQ